MTAATVDISYLNTNLRLWLGDLDPSQYRYLDIWLNTSLVASVKALRSWWHDKYLVDDTTLLISRNPDRLYNFEYPEPPVIDHRDEMPIIIMASIIIKSGSLQNNSWNLASWRDFEINYSPAHISKAQTDSLKMDWETLKDYLKPPQKRLATPVKRHTPGFTKNSYERDLLDP